MIDTIRVVLDKDAFVPVRAHKDDAGFDLRSPVSVRINVCDSAVIDTGVHVQIPAGYVGMLKSRSGMNVKYGLQNEGVIDSGYTGSIRVKIYNHGKRDIVIERGDKITQLVILPIVTPSIELVEALPDTERGSNGFGSTGN